MKLPQLAAQAELRRSPNLDLVRPLLQPRLQVFEGHAEIVITREPGAAKGEIKFNVFY